MIPSTLAVLGRCPGMGCAQGRRRALSGVGPGGAQPARETASPSVSKFTPLLLHHERPLQDLGVYGSAAWSQSAFEVWGERVVHATRLTIPFPLHHHKAPEEPGLRVADYVMSFLADRGVKDRSRVGASLGERG